MPSNLTSGDLSQTFSRPQLNSKINNLFNQNNNQENRSSLNDLNKNALTPETIKYIQEKYLPIVIQYTKQKELRELLVNPYLTNPKLEEEIINSIEQIYYSDLNEEDDRYENKVKKQQIEDSIENEISISEFDEQNQSNKEPFDPFEHILNKLPDTMDLGFILEEKKKLNKQLLVVTKRVSDLIQQNQSAYNNELASVVELQEILNDAITTCSSGRCKLDLAKKNLTYPNLNIISTYRRREIMITLLKEFFTIKTLLQTGSTLNELFSEDEDYTNAIRLCLECRKIIFALNRYKCVTDLGTKLNCIIEITEERLDQALAKLCINFNSQQFMKIRETFNLLEKTQFLYDQLLIHFSTAINDKAFNIVNNYVKLCTNSNDSLGNFNDSKSNSIDKCDFENVCSQLSSECFLPCLIDFNKSMWHIMVNYRRLLNLHKLDLNNEDSQTELDCNLTLIKQKLKYGLSKIWQEIESKLVILIRNHNLSIYSFDDFISMINIVRKIISIGCEFSSAEKSEQLEDTLKKATSEYFYIYHKTKIEEVKVFLETELWQLVPMKPGFSIEHLHEFSFLINKEKFLNSNGVDKEDGLSYFDLDEMETKSQTTPFDKFMKSSKNSKTDEFLEDNKLEDEEHQTELNKESSHSVPVVITNSSLNILRIVGKYIQIMYIFDQISFDVLLCIFQLYNYYIYGVYTFFGGEELFVQLVPTMKPNLANLLKQIESSLIIDKTSSNKNDSRIKLHPPELSNMVNLNDKKYLFGLLERAIGSESL